MDKELTVENIVAALTLVVNQSGDWQGEAEDLLDRLERLDGDTVVG